MFNRFLILVIFLLSTSGAAGAASWVYIAGNSSYNPLTAVASIKMWLDPSNVGSVTASGGLMVTVADLSGNGNDATVATLTDATAPTYPATINGLNALGFTQATKQCAVVNTAVQFPFTVFFVVRTTAILGVLNDVFGAVIGDFFDIYAPANIIEIYDGTAYADFDDIATANNNVFYSIVSDGTVAGTAMYKSGVALTVNGTSGTNFNVAKLALKYIGCHQVGGAGGSWTSASLGEIAAYGVVANGTQIADAYTYYKAKWGTL